MNWLRKVFGAKPSSQSDRNFFDACKAFSTGEKIWKEAVSIKGIGWQESKLIKITEALKYFDKAIKIGLVEPDVFSHGFDESEAFELRGSCLNDLGFYFDALEDYDRAIEKNPRKGVAHKYFMRSLIKDSLFDFDGSLSDAKEAIRLSKLNNDDNAYWNNYAKSTGFYSHTIFLEMCLPTEEKMIHRKRAYSDKRLVEDELRKIKRRVAGETGNDAV